MIKKCISLLLLAAVVTTGATIAGAQTPDEHAYTEGPVLVVSYIKTEPGMFEEYLRYLDSTYKKLMEEYKKSGVILDYAVYQAEPRTQSDANLILTVSYKNYAALDHLNDRTDPVGRKIWGSLAKSAEASAARGKLRKEVGGQTVRQLLLK
jgi:L-rhamnose mutarotase